MVCNFAISFPIHVFYLLLFVSKTYQSRKYDIEAECLKLYKEDLQTVLLRFRRSSDYLKILEEKNEEFGVFVTDVKNQIVYYYLDQLDKKVAETVGMQAENKEEETTTERPGAPAPSGLLMLKSARRQNDPNKLTAVERLDSYSKLSSALSLEERNHMRDLGFEFAGHIIHSLVRNMDLVGSTDTPLQSTLAGEDKTTTHMSVHEVTKEPSTGEANTGSDAGENPKAGRKGFGFSLNQSTTEFLNL